MISIFKTTSRLFTALLFLACFAGMKEAKASHLAAGDLYVTYIGAGLNGCTGTTEYKYEITLQVYKACETGSIDLGTTENVTIRSVKSNDTLSTYPGGSGTYKYGMNFSFSSPEIDTLDGLCDSFKKLNTCRTPGQGGTYFAFIRHTYKFIWVAPSPQTDWTFSWTNSARNGSIVNLASKGSIYIEAGLNNLTKYNNSTPRFTVSPLPYICVNQPAIYLNGPLDPNNDSLHIYSHDPLNSATTTETYAAGFTSANPVASAATNPFAVNPSTGTATFTPTQTGKFVLAFQCDEYERGTGIQLGYIMRDVQISIFTCNAPPPAVDSVTKGLIVKEGSVVGTTTQGNAIFVCPGANMSFTLSSQSTNPNANVFMDADLSTTPGATFTTTNNGLYNPTGTYSWTPSPNDVGEHTVIITSKDSTCTGSGFSIVLRNYTVVLIKVLYGIHAGPDLPICSIDPKPRQLAIRGDKDITVAWNNADGDNSVLSNPNSRSPLATVKNTTTFYVKATNIVSPCKVEDTIVVYVDTSNTLNAFPNNPVVMCRPDYLQLDAILTGKGPITNASCGPTSLYAGATTDSATLFGSPVYGVTPYDTIGSATPLLPQTSRTTKQQFLIRKDELLELGLRSSIFTFMSFEVAKGTQPATYNYEYKNLRVAMKCTNASELSEITGFESGLTAVYYNPAGQVLSNGWIPIQFSTPYAWDTTRNLLVEICYSYNDSVVAGCGVSSAPPPLIKFAPTTYVSGLYLTDTNSNVKDLCGTLQDSRIEPRLGRPVFGLKFSTAPSAPFTVKWYPSTYLSDSTILQPLAYVPKSAKYYVESFGSSGCRLLDSVDIYVPVHDFSVSPKDTAICLGDYAYLIAKNGFVYRWHEYVNGEYKDASKSLSCTDCANPFAYPKVTTTYKIEVGDSVFCYDTIEAVVEVLPIPDVRILNHHDTTIKYGQSIQLLASGARKYNWAPPASLNNPNISYPVGTPTEPTTYVVTGIGTDGCRATDTIRVNVDFRDKLMVPSAFSPNGDGKNDIFRVTNLTFQRVMEFRVFNRWGQEVFSGNNNTGWDGTWKGEPQEIGNYTYVIKLGYPDGLVETYKGDVSIIR